MQVRLPQKGEFFMAEKKPTDDRVRTWATVVYPESAPDQWLQTLGDQCIPVFVSPLHDKDINPTGEPKKPHYHVMFVFDGKKSRQQVDGIRELIGGVGLEKVQSTRGYARYLCHLDNPEKAQYDPSDVVQYGGADYMSTIGLAIDKYKAIKEMMAFCRENRIVSYSKLLEYASEYEMGWFRVLCDNGTVVMKEYLKSITWTADRGEN